MLVCDDPFFHLKERVKLSSYLVVPINFIKKLVSKRDTMMRISLKIIYKKERTIHVSPLLYFV